MDYLTIKPTKPGIDESILNWKPQCFKHINTTLNFDKTTNGSNQLMKGLNLHEKQLFTMGTEIKLAWKILFQLGFTLLNVFMSKYM